MPKIGVEVLGAYKSYTTGKYRLMGLKRIKAHDEMWECDGMKVDENNWTITHWQPRPDPPE